jgi:hypothetical protein
MREINMYTEYFERSEGKRQRAGHKGRQAGNTRIYLSVTGYDNVTEDTHQRQVVLNTVK